MAGDIAAVTCPGAVYVDLELEGMAREGLVLARPWLLRAAFAMRIGLFEEAESCLTRARELDPVSMGVWNSSSR